MANKCIYRAIDQWCMVSEIGLNRLFIRCLIRGSFSDLASVEALNFRKSDRKAKRLLKRIESETRVLNQESGKE
jgi:hypothetical protein